MLFLRKLYVSFTHALAVLKQHTFEQRCPVCYTPFTPAPAVKPSSAPQNSPQTNPNTPYTNPQHMPLAANATGPCKLVNKPYSVNNILRSLCPECQTLLARKTSGFCRICGEFFAHSSVNGVCALCQSSPRPWGRIYFYGAYTGELRRLIQEFKFNKALQHGKLLGTMLASHPDFTPQRPITKLTAPSAVSPMPATELNNTPEFTSATPTCHYDYIVPVPLHHSRLIWRGFNQAAELARPLSRTLAVPINNNILSRHLKTRPQTGLTRKERAKNLRGAFASAPLNGERILLIDDIMTTGATFNAATLCLLKAGAGHVDIAAVARTPAKNSCREI